MSCALGTIFSNQLRKSFPAATSLSITSKVPPCASDMFSSVNTPRQNTLVSSDDDESEAEAATLNDFRVAKQEGVYFDVVAAAAAKIVVLEYLVPLRNAVDIGDSSNGAFVFVMSRGSRFYGFIADRDQCGLEFCDELQHGRKSVFPSSQWMDYTAPSALSRAIKAYLKRGCTAFQGSLPPRFVSVFFSPLLPGWQPPSSQTMIRVAASPPQKRLELLTEELGQPGLVMPHPTVICAVLSQGVYANAHLQGRDRLLMRPEFQMEKRPLSDGAQWGVRGPLEAFLVMFGRRIIRDVMMGRYPAEHVQLAGPCRTPGFSGAWVSLLFLFEENQARSGPDGSSMAYLPVAGENNLRGRGRLHSLYMMWLVKTLPPFVEENMHLLDPYTDQVLYRAAKNANAEMDFDSARDQVSDFTPKCVFAALEKPDLKDAERYFLTSFVNGMDQKFPGLQSVYKALILNSTDSGDSGTLHAHFKRRRTSSTADAATRASRTKNIITKLNKGKSYRITCLDCKFCPYGSQDALGSRVAACASDLDIDVEQLSKDVFGTANPTVPEVAILAKTTAHA